MNCKFIPPVMYKIWISKSSFNKFLMNKFSYPKKEFIEFEKEWKYNNKKKVEVKIRNNNGVAILLLKFQFQQKHNRIEWKWV